MYIFFILNRFSSVVLHSYLILNNNLARDGNTLHLTGELALKCGCQKTAVDAWRQIFNEIEYQTGEYYKIHYHHGMPASRYFTVKLMLTTGIYTMSSDKREPFLFENK